MSDEKPTTEIHPRELMRLVHGELTPERAREVLDRLARDPQLARRHRALAATWEGLELPEASPPPSGFAARVVARAEERAAAGAPLAWSAAPGWARAAGAAALAAGLAAGLGLGRWPQVPTAPPKAVAAPPAAEGPAIGGPPGAGSAPAATGAVARPVAEGSPAEGTPPETARVDAPAELAADLTLGLGGGAGLTSGYWAALGLGDGPGETGNDLDLVGPGDTAGAAEGEPGP